MFTFWRHHCYCFSLQPQKASPRPGACGQSAKSHREWQLGDKSYCWLNRSHLVGVRHFLTSTLVYATFVSAKLMRSSSSQWLSHAPTKWIFGWSTEIPVANTQLGDGYYHPSSHLTEDIKQLLLVTGMCLALPWNHSIGWISACIRDWGRILTIILSNYLKWKKQEP